MPAVFILAILLTLDILNCALEYQYRCSWRDVGTKHRTQRPLVASKDEIRLSQSNDDFHPSIVCKFHLTRTLIQSHALYTLIETPHHPKTLHRLDYTLDNPSKADSAEPQNRPLYISHYIIQSSFIWWVVLNNPTGFEVGIVHDHRRNIDKHKAKHIILDKVHKTH